MSVTAVPLALVEPETENLIVTSAAGPPAVLRAVAVTQCCVLTGSVSAGGASVSVAAPSNFQTLVTVFESCGPCGLMYVALMLSVPAMLPV